MRKFNALRLALRVKFFIAQFFIIIAAVHSSVTAQTPINFSSSALIGENVSNPTSIQFGPDQRLYVSQQNGTIRAYTVRKNGPNNYEVTNSETINLIRNIPNHDDDGTPNSLVITRQVTGILVLGSAANPIIYVTSSDSRIGGGGTAGDKNLDTNSGILSKLTWNGTAWEKIDVIKGLPRSEENHSNNGLTLDAATNTLYIAQGGHTNAGSPSNNFAFLTEYALSAAILKVDLSMIDNQYGGSYTLPTLDDPSRPNSGPNGEDINDPWGGNDGLNQAKLVPGGPVQIYSSGYRNAYDVLITRTPGKAGRMYTIDNGANGGWGGYPDKEGTPEVTNDYVVGEPGSTTPGLNDAKINNLDNLHLVSAPGMSPIYGGHPNPIRANPAGAGIYTFNNTTGVGQFSLNPTPDWPPVPVSMAHPVESDFRNPGVNDGALYTWAASTNGLAEYTATSFFNGELTGDLLAASFDGNIYRIKLNSAGTAVEAGSVLAGGFGSQPLDITAQGDNEIFPGTIWAATYGASSITVFEPVVPSSVWTDVAYNSSGITPPARHENGFVEVNGKFYIIGGRTERNVNIFDPVTKAWSLGAASPVELNHFQAVVYNEEIYAICAMQGSYPNEVPVTNIYKYNTRTNTWSTGAAIPANRRRGSSGVVLYNNKFYVVAGIQNGHINGWVPWVDEYDPATGTWTILPDAPVARDHFMATLINGKIYVAGGRQTNYPDYAANTIGNVDVYDIASRTWSTPTQIPTQRGAPGVAYINGELVIAGGEILSSGSALSVVEAYNPVTNIWQTKPSLNVGRHATQMISYQGKLYLAAGSTTRGGSGQTNTMSVATYVTNCTGDVGNFNLDDDADGYSNGDETANSTDPCSAASKPDDFDLDGLSDLTDTDDDNDGLNDQTDKFALDSQNGTDTNIPINYPFLNADPGFGLFGLGFTGLMTNNTSDYKNNYDPNKPNLVMGGAVGIATSPAESGDPTTNDQKYAFQFGLNVNQSTPPFTIRGKLLGSSFFDGASGSQLGTQSQGIYFGTGDQDNYLKLVLHANNGNAGLQILMENGGTVTYQNIFPVTGILSASAVDVFFDINPATGTVQCRYQTNSASAPVNVGPTFTLTGNMLTALQDNNALAVGLIASSGNQAPFTASWDYLHIGSSAPETLTEVIRINAGGPDLQFQNESWKADQYFTGGSTYTKIAAISNTTNDALYQTERFGNFSYNIPVPQNGRYTVELHLAELYFTSANRRVFNLNVEGGQFQLSNIDLFKDYGGRYAASVIKASNVQVSDGFITIALSNVIDNAKISGIAVFLQSASSNENQPPVVTKPSDVTLTGGQSWSYQVVASDPDAGAVLTYSATDLPASLSINPTTGLISGNVTAGAGTYTVNLTVKDQQNLTALTSFLITVNAPVNQPPVVSKPLDITLNGGQSWTYQVVASDPDAGAVLTYSASDLPSSLTIDPATGVITGNVTAGPGSYTVNLTVKDQQNLSAVTSFVITITNLSTLTEVIRINAGGPSLQFGNESWTADQFFTGGSTFTRIAAISNTTNDALYHTERFGNFSYNIPVPQNGRYTVELHFAELYFTSANRRVFNLNVEGGQFQLSNIDLFKDYGGRYAASVIKASNVQVSDGFITIALSNVIDNAKISGIAVFLQSAPPNQPPVVTKPSDVTLTGGQSWSYQVVASDPDAGTVLTYSATDLPASLSINSATGLITGDVTAAAGSYTVNLTVKDQQNLSAVTSFVITVNAPVNQPPVVTKPSDVTLAGGQSWSYQVVASDPDAGAVLTYSAAALPASLSINPTTGLITGNITAGPGSYTVNLTVKDQQNLSAVTSFVITVNAPVNQPPVVTKPSDVTLTGGQSWSYQVIASDPDAGAVLTYSATNLPASLTIDSTTGLITGTVTGTAGSYTVTLTVTDEKSLSAGTNFIITVAPANSPPVVTKPADITLNMKQSWSYQVIASDPDAGDVLTYSATNLPASLTLNAGTGLISGKITAAAGTYPVTLSVKDQANLSSSTSFTITVSAKGKPVVTQPADITLTRGQNWSYQVLASDPDSGAVLTYTASNLPASLVLNSASGLISGNVTALKGSFNVGLSVKDQDDSTGNANFVITVNEASSLSEVIRINSGGPAVQYGNELWKADQYFTGGRTFATTSAISGTTNDALYQTERFGNITYNIPVPQTGKYTIEIHLAELYHSSAGRRVFNLSMENGQFSRQGIDLFKDYGGRYAASVIKAENIQVTDGLLTIVISNVVDNAKISGIAVFLQSDGSINQAPTANAGADKTITLPVSSVTLSGSGSDPEDGTNLSYSWSQASGPSTAIFSASQQSPTISNLIAGTYTFNLVVKDQQLSSSPADQVIVVVNPVPSGQQVFSLTLINAATEQDIQVLSQNAILNLANLPSQALNIRANTSPSIVGRVVFSLTGKQTQNRTETGAPYSLFGDSNGNYASWTPLVGSYTLTATPYTSSSGGTAGIPININFTVINQSNQNPVLAAIGNKTVNEEEELSFTVSATDGDVPANTLSYSLADPATGNFPSGAVIDADSGLFTWTPSEAQGPGTYRVKVLVSDGTGSDAEEIQITVSDGNVLPVLAAIGNKTVNEEEELSFTVSATDGDVPANTLSYSLADPATGNFPSGAVIDADSGLFTWTPSEAQGPGTYRVKVLVSDGTGSDAEEIQITVSDGNVLPVLAAIGNKTVNEEEELSFIVSATDGDVPANTLSYSLADPATGNFPSGAVIDADSGLFTWTPSEAQGPGTYRVKVLVSDGTGSDAEEIQITVSDGNVLPVLAAIGNKTVNEDEELSFIVSATDGDVPANTLSYSLADPATGNFPSGAVIDADSGLFTWTPSEAQGPGTYRVKVLVSDGTGSDAEEIQITVSDGNVLPVLAAIGNKTVNEEEELSFTVSATDGDVPANTLSYSLADPATGNFPSGAVIDADSGLFTWTPSEAQGPGTYRVKVLVSDGTGSDAEEIQITVSDGNVLPVLAAIGNKTVNEDEELSFIVSATDGDVPANTLSYSLADPATGNFPSGAVIDADSGLFTWTPSEAQGPGTYRVKVLVSDGTGSDAEEIQITVSDGNVLPVLAAIGNKTVNEEEELSFTVSATDGDVPANTLSYSLADPATGNFPSGAVIDADSGLFTWTPSEAQGPGTYRVKVLVSDGTGSDAEEIQITVSDGNVLPVLAAIGNKTVNEEEELSFTVSATDGDVPANTLSYSLADPATGNFPSGAVIDADSGLFTWTPSEAQGPGTYRVKVLVSDGTGSDAEEIQITVSDINGVPVISQPADLTVTANETLINYQVTVNDPDDDAVLQFAATGLPEGLIMSSSGMISGTAINSSGTYGITVTVTDNHNASAQTNFNVVVTNRPLLTNPSLIQVSVNEPFGYALTATDGDSDPVLSYSESGLPGGLLLDSGTGQISGFVGQSGTYRVSITVTDETGLSNTVTFDIDVIDEQSRLMNTKTLPLHETLRMQNRNLSHGLYTVYPNPASREFSVNVSVQDRSEWQFVMYNTLGYRIELPKVQLEKGLRTVSFDISQFNLVPGVYYLIITNTLNEKKTCKIIVN